MHPQLNSTPLVAVPTEYTYRGKRYTLYRGRVFNENSDLMFDLDLSATDYANNKVVAEIAFRVAIEAYFSGIEKGKEEIQKELKKVLDI